MAKTSSNDGAKKKSIPAKDVDAYLAAVPEEARPTLLELRKIIRAAAPMAEEVISYGMPAYRRHGPLVYFAAAKNHCGFYGAGYAVLEAYKDEIKPYKNAKTTLHFSVGKPLPAALITKIVKARIAENEAGKTA